MKILTHPTESELRENMCIESNESWEQRGYYIDRQTIVFLAIALAVKLLIASIIPLSHDEAYYWVWGQDLQWSYYDHPAFVAWLFAAGSLFGDVFVRWPAVMFGHLALGIWFYILRRYCSRTQNQYWLWLMTLCPLTGFGTILVTPDLPLITWWSASLLAFLICLDKPTLRTALVLGLSLGFGFCSKYHMVLFVPCALISIGLQKRWTVLNTSRLLMVFIGGIIGSLPVLIWNYQNDWVSFTYQLTHGLSSETWNPAWPAEFILSQAMIVSPPILYLACRRRAASKIEELAPFAWFPLAFFFYTSFRSEAESNWTMVAYPALFALAVYGLQDFKWVRRTSVAWGIFVIATVWLASPWSPNGLRVSKLKELYQFDEVAQDLDQDAPCYASSYQMAAQLSYRLDRPIPKLPGIGRFDHYDLEKNQLEDLPVIQLVIPDGKIPHIKELNDYHIDSIQNLDQEFDLIIWKRDPSHLTPQKQKVPETVSQNDSPTRELSNSRITDHWFSLKN